MSMGSTEVRFIVAWQTYRVGDVIRPAATLRTWLIGNGYCKDLEIEQPSRPARLARGVASKIAEANKRLFGAEGEGSK
jgi:hypothetical protein